MAVVRAHYLTMLLVSLMMNSGLSIFIGNKQCDVPPPPASIIWQTALLQSNEADMKTIKWNDRHICSNASACFPSFPNAAWRHDDIQLRPFFIQEGLPLRILITKDSNVSIFRVTEEGFRACKVESPDNNYTLYIDGDSSDYVQYSLNTTQFIRGSIYFIAGSSNGLSRNDQTCSNGYRLNITVLAHRCQTNSAKLCGDKELCYFTPNMTAFECWCCDKSSSGPRKCSAVVANQTQNVLPTPILCVYEPKAQCERKNPCHHGICTKELDGLKCYCEPGYNGPCCQREFDECLSSPCQNEGICEDLIDGYRCQCLRGWQGENCETPNKMATCNPNPCAEHHSCVEGDYDIQCIPDYMKGHLIRCEFNYCYNGGECFIVHGTEHCLCGDYFGGRLCEIAIESLENSMKHHPLRNMWVALGSLGTAFLIFALVLLACHCHTYSCHLSSSPSLPYRRQRSQDDISEHRRLSRSSLKQTMEDFPMTACGPMADHDCPLSAEANVGIHISDTHRLVTRQEDS